jgi:hypothetical protein
MTENLYSAPKASAVSDAPPIRVPSKRFGRLYAIAAALFAVGFIWSRYAAQAAAEQAIRDYGHNVDSGAYLLLIGATYFLPAAVIFAIASTAMFRAWQFKLLFHLAAWGWVASPFLYVLVAQLRQLVAA